MKKKSYDRDKNKSQCKVERGMYHVRDLLIKCFGRSERGEEPYRGDGGWFYNLTSQDKGLKEQR